MNESISIELLEKYIKGECIAEEITLVKDWYFSFEQEHDYVSDLTVLEKEKLEEQIYTHIITNIGVVDKNITKPQINKPKYLSLRSWYAVATALFLLFTGVLFSNYLKIKNTQTAVVSTQGFVVNTNNTRQIHKLILPDGSRVWLNPKAQIRYPKMFDKKYRMISMSGMCFFEITKNPARPFIINSRSIITRVWGTSFLVRDNVKSNSADVSVVTGKVSVSIKGKNINETLKLDKREVMLYPHQKAVYSINRHFLKHENANNEPALRIWNRLNLFFDNKPLREIIPILNLKFHVNIRVTNEKLNQCVLNADLTEFNLPDVLEVLKKSLNVNYEIKNNNNIELE